MPPKAYMFGLPYEDYESLHVRKYGFHGTSHRFVSAALAEAMGKDIKDLKIVSCHLGNGSSITAVDGGKSVDTSMGFTPLDGVVMGTRSGSVDPSAVTFVADKHGFTPSEMSDYMNKKSGFLGVSGFSSDSRDLEEAISAGPADPNYERANLAVNILTHNIKKYIGSYAAIMNGLEAVVFTAGIGENNPHLRELVCTNMEFLGLEFDKAANDAAPHVSENTKISTADSKVAVYVLPTNEELVIAQDTAAIVSAL
jgi:acetate kinase